MKIEHVAVWTTNLERLKDFYVDFFDGQEGEKYINSRTGFASYFVTFETGTRLEIMTMPEIPENQNDPIRQYMGWIHVAFSTGSRQEVDRLTDRLREKGYQVVDGSRETGDGYYESCVLDPDGNRIEITI